MVLQVVLKITDTLLGERVSIDPGGLYEVSVVKDSRRLPPQEPTLPTTRHDAAPADSAQIATGKGPSHN